jgi:predicted nucleic acid-binding protein
MILVDANLLLYAYAAELPQHAAAHAWLDQQLNTLPRVGLPWPSLLAFVVSHGCTAAVRTMSTYRYGSKSTRAIRGMGIPRIGWLVRP